MSLRKNVPFAPVTAPAPGIRSAEVPACSVISCPCAAAAETMRRRTHRLRRMRTILFLAALSAALSLQAKELVMRADHVLDGRGNDLGNVAVVIDGTKIVRIESHPSHVDEELGHLTLMPGGIDTHVHIGWHFGFDGRLNDDGKGETPDQYALFA